MARDHPANLGSSPPSSNEATHIGSPSTNITAMSTEDYSSSPQGSAYRLRINTRVTAQEVSSSISGGRLLLPTHGFASLSPTAREFTPSSAAFNVTPRAASFPQSAYGSRSGVSSVRPLMVSSLPDVPTGQNNNHGPIGQSSSRGNLNDPNGDRRLPLTSEMTFTWEAFSTDENVTRSFQIYDRNIPFLFQITGQYSTQFRSIEYVDNQHIHSGIVRFTFKDDRDAKQAFVLTTSLTHPTCSILQMTPKDIAAANGKDPDTVSNFEGQLIVSVIPVTSSSVMPCMDEVFHKLNFYGHIKALCTISPVGSQGASMRVEYHNTAIATIVLEQLGGSRYQDIYFVISRYEPDIVNRTSPVNGLSSSGAGQPSLTGRSTVPSGDIARLNNVMARVMRESAPSTASGPSRSNHNHVDIDRIRSGMDVRTTIMLRNIPNKVDQATLKVLLDETSFGAFDFMYLRIDFANNCNVGYAFINFVDALSIIPFARARAGVRWNIFSSDKVAEISYATIQGRDCLVQKFRNSSVMLEHPSFRPKLYITRPSQFAGQEEPFPDPDNYSKMRRSIDNAEHIGLFPLARGNHQHVQHNQPNEHNNTRSSTFPTGSRFDRANRQTRFAGYRNTINSHHRSINATRPGLFAPREGQAHREEQRRRRSQFDRGTPGAEYEAFSYRLTDPALSPARNTTARMQNAFNRLRL